MEHSKIKLRKVLLFLTVSLFLNLMFIGCSDSTSLSDINTGTDAESHDQVISAKGIQKPYVTVVRFKITTLDDGSKKIELGKMSLKEVFNKLDGHYNGLVIGKNATPIANFIIEKVSHELKWGFAVINNDDGSKKIIVGKKVSGEFNRVKAKKSIPILRASNLSSVTIEGTVKDASNQQPLSGADVLVGAAHNGSFTSIAGTSSASDGSYELTVDGYQSIDMRCSLVVYATVTYDGIALDQETEEVNFYLPPMVD